METKLSRVLFEAIGRGWERMAEQLREDQRPRIGVSQEGFGELGGGLDAKEMWVHCLGRSYRVVPLSGLDNHDVALIL